MADNKGTVREVKMEGDEIVVVYAFKRNEFEDERLMGYSLFEDVKRKVANLLANKIFEEQKDVLKKQILDGVNWPELVRSEVAQRVIAEVARKNFDR